MNRLHKYEIGILKFYCPVIIETIIYEYLIISQIIYLKVLESKQNIFTIFFKLV